MFRNCNNCPHKDVDINLKNFYTSKTSDSIFKNCLATKDVRENIFCFGVSRTINWQKVFDDLSKELLPRYSTGAKK
ncbi:MAG: hypothetical protein LBF97_01800 [Elusimicrobiota bacterium]|jgi:hypothetical protein|nr:hypothetical protein [Elusimicrobiota bacterium]